MWNSSWHTCSYNRNFCSHGARDLPPLRWAISSFPTAGYVVRNAINVTSRFTCSRTNGQSLLNHHKCNFWRELSQFISRFGQFVFICKYWISTAQMLCLQLVSHAQIFQLSSDPLTSRSSSFATSRDHNSARSKAPCRSPKITNFVLDVGLSWLRNPQIAPNSKAKACASSSVWFGVRCCRYSM